MALSHVVVELDRERGELLRNILKSKRQGGIHRIQPVPNGLQSDLFSGLVQSYSVSNQLFLDLVSCFTLASTASGSPSFIIHPLESKLKNDLCEVCPSNKKFKYTNMS